MSLFHGGKIFIIYSVSGIGVLYMVDLPTADRDSNLMDPKNWIKSPVPVFKTRPENDRYGLGHDSFTKSKDGFEDLVTHHARNYTETKGDPLFDPDHRARAGVVRRNEDGTPGLGVPKPDNLWTFVMTDVLPPDGGPKADTPAVGLAAEVQSYATAIVVWHVM